MNISTMNQGQISNDTCCQAAACPKHDDCVRHTNYLKAQAESEVYHLLNPNRVSYNENGCPHLLVAHTERWAYGFTKLRGTVPLASKSMVSCSGLGMSQPTYYRNLRGERGLRPAEQQRILQAVVRAGGDPTVGFDRYEEQMVFVNGM